MATIDTPIGRMIAVASDAGVCVLEFVDGRTTPSSARSFVARHGLTAARGSSPHLDRLRGELDAYFRGRLRRFETPLDLRGTPFQRAVWSRLARTPYGETLTYAELAARAGRPLAVRAAGHANGRNPVSILVPCHRVVGTDGSLHGYGGGLWRKRWLLELERGESAPQATRDSRLETRTKSAGSSPRPPRRSRPATRTAP
jgi:AraC family transcriptional regulator of adaptative response/methylated-DNA-[protein]-cysteine methyltransferase